jgi:acyl-CoA thioester hydrolase
MELKLKSKVLTNRTKLNVKFSEVDLLGIVWHGNYIRFFEEGREAFGEEFDLRYLDIYKEGYITPIVQISLDYKRPLAYGDSMIIETTYVDCEAAKIIYDYKIFRNTDNALVVSGSSTQVFLNLERQLLLTSPPFFLKWKKNNGLI